MGAILPRRILTVSNLDKTARLWHGDGRSLGILQDLNASNALRAVFSPDGHRLLTSSQNLDERVHGYTHTVRLWDEDGRPLLSFEDSANGLFSPDGRWILTTSVHEGKLDPTARLWDAYGKLLATLQGSGLVFSPDGRRILTILTDKAARLWEVVR
jgi:hypothetical protein